MATISGKVYGGGTVSGKVKVPEQVIATELVFENRFEFPNVGRKDRLYIATDENAAYRFDVSQNIYIKLNDYDAIQSKLMEV